MFGFPLDRWRLETRAYWHLAWPIVIAQLSFIGMGSIDTVLAGRLGATALAAVAVGANLFFLLLVFFSSLLMAVAPLVAQALGADSGLEARAAPVRAGLRLALGCGLLWAVAMLALRRLVLDRLELDAQTDAYAHAYLGALAWSTVPFCLSFVLRYTADAHGLTRIALSAGLAGLACNAVLAPPLMFGVAGLPALGPAGAGYATSASVVVMVLVYLAFYRVRAELSALRLWQRHVAPVAPALRELLRIGLPTAAILTAEASLFQLGALIVARFGAATMAAHQVAINFASLMFMVPMSIGLAATVRVGQAAGAQDADAVALRGRAGMLLAIGFALASASLMLALPRAIVAVYTRDAAVAQQAILFLQLAAIFQLFDGIQATANGALRGVKDTRLPMVVTIAAYWVVALPLAVALAWWTPLQARGVWCGFIAGLAVAAVGLSLRFLARTRRAY